MMSLKLREQSIYLGQIFQVKQSPSWLISQLKGSVCYKVNSAQSYGLSMKT